MTLILKDITFINDFFYIDTPDGDILVLNKVQEELTIANRAVNQSLHIDNINIGIQTDDKFIKCPCVIGMGNQFIKIETDYKTLEGAVLTSENMEYCTITVYES